MISASRFRSNATLLVTLISLLFGCASDRVATPVVTGYHAVHSSTQQGIVAEAVDEAVANLPIEPGALALRRCEMTAVFPHDGDLLNNYIRTRVEGRLAEAGYRVRVKASESNARCTIAISKAGATLRERNEKVSAGLVVANVFLQFPTLFTSWYWLPIYITERWYIAEAKMSVYLFPETANVEPLRADGEGRSVIQIQGTGDAYYPIVEGTAYQSRPKKTRTKSIKIKVAE